MNKSFIKALALLVVLATMFYVQSCNTSTASQANLPQHFSSALLHSDFDDESLSFQNLRLYPIYAETSPEPIGEFISLNDALSSNKVDISEKGISSSRGDDVNTLFIENKSTDTVFMMAGEVVKGGKQDRTLATDVVLEPHSGKYDVAVFCVEQHRWQPKSENVVVGKPQEEMKFKASAPVVKNSIRKMATVDKKQTKVWEEVTSSNAKASVHSETDAYTAIEKNTNYQKLEKDYRDFFEKALKQNRKIVGFIAVTGNKVIGCDVFGTQQLFNLACSTILPSYINEAVHDGKKVTVKKDSMELYFTRLCSDKKMQDEFIAKNGTLFMHKLRAVHLNTY